MIRQMFRKNKRRRAEMPSPTATSLSSISSDDLASYSLVEETPPPEGIELLKSQKLQVAAGDDASPAAGEAGTEEELLDTEGEGVGEEGGAGAGAGSNLVVTPAPQRGVTYTPDPLNEEERLRKKEENAMIHLFQKAKAPKKLKFPSKYPAYLKEPPRLAFEETSTSLRRKLYNQAKLQQRQDELRPRNEKTLVHTSPRINTAVKLRSLYIRREPIVSQYFSDHYNKYRKPPFKFLRRNYTCYSKLRPATEQEEWTTTTTTTTSAPISTSATGSISIDLTEPTEPVPDELPLTETADIAEPA